MLEENFSHFIAISSSMVYFSYSFINNHDSSIINYCLKKVKQMNKIILEKGVEKLIKDKIPDDIPSSFKCAASAADVSDFMCLKRFWDNNAIPLENGIATVWVEGDSLNVFAIMNDSDVFSDAVGKNDKTWSKGDVLELFFQPDGHRNYFELHLAPNLATLELSIPDIDGFRSKKYDFEKLFFDSGMSCATGIFNQDGVSGWWGLMKIPAQTLGLKIKKGALGKFSICRYNYTRENGKSAVEHSASAALTKLNFHSPEEWQTLVLK
jgi:hypothetical protein